MDLDTNFRDRIRWALDTHNPPVSQSELARHLGMSPQAVQQWTSGTTKSPQRDKLAQAADYLGVELAWLAYGQGLMRKTDETAAPRATLPTELAMLAEEWSSAMLSALPDTEKTNWRTALPHPSGKGKLDVDWLSDTTIGAVYLYRELQTLVIKSRQRLWNLAVIRAALPVVPARRAVLVIAPLEPNALAPIPDGHIKALAAEANLLDIDVQHAATPTDAAAILSGAYLQPATLPVEDDLGLNPGLLM